MTTTEPTPPLSVTQAACRRKLFPAEGDSSLDHMRPSASPSASNPSAAPGCTLDRQDSACSTLTIMGAPQELAGPSTPPREQAGPAAASPQAVLYQALEAPLLSALQVRA